MYSQLIHSHLLQSLGIVIIHSLWQSLILLVIYKAIIAVRKEMSPAVKHNLSAIFVILTFGWFLYTFQKSYFNGGTHLAGIAKISAPTEVASFSLINIPTEISAALSIAYLVLLSFLLTRLFFSIIRTLRIHTANLSPVDEAIATFTNHAVALLKIRRKVTVWIGKNITTPATIGFLKPIILLPAVCLTHLTPHQIEAIILHELSHIRRNDFVLNMVLVVIETILFFNPVVFFFMKTIREERENCCDDLVLNNNYEPLHYAKALLTFSREQITHQKLAMNATSRKHQLLYRIKRITGGDLEKPVHFSGRIMVFTLIAILFLSFSVFTNQHRKNTGVTEPDGVKSTVEVKATPAHPPQEKIATLDKNANQHEIPETKDKPDEPELPVLPQLSPEVKDLSNNIKGLIENSIATINPTKQKLYADLIEKDARTQVQHIMKQFSEKKIEELLQQKQHVLQNVQLEKELAYLEQFRINPARQINGINISGDSILLNSKLINEKLKEVIIKGKANIESNRDFQFFISPDAGKPVKVMIGKRLRTADI